jgi:hypothetical protein
LIGIAYLRAPASLAGSLGKNCRPRVEARRGVSPNALNRLNFIFDADSMAQASWQERRQPGTGGAAPIGRDGDQGGGPCLSPLGKIRRTRRDRRRDRFE